MIGLMKKRRVTKAASLKQQNSMYQQISYTSKIARTGSLPDFWAA